MGMTLKGKKRSSIQDLERKMLEGWMPKDEAELQEVAAGIVSLHAPRHIVALAKLLVENPGELGSNQVLDALYKNLSDILAAEVISRFRELEGDLEDAMKEYEENQYRKVSKGN